MDENQRQHALEALILIDRINNESVVWDAIITEKMKIMCLPEETIALSEKISTLMFKLKNAII